MSRSGGSGRARFPEFTDDWVPRVFGSLVHSIASGRSSQLDDDGAYPVYGASGVLGWTNSPGYEGENVIVGRVGSAGKVMRVGGRYGLSDNALLVVPNEELDPDFAILLLETARLSRLVTGSSQPLMTGSALRSLAVSVPSKAEQQRIAAVLRLIDAKVNLLAERESLLDAYSDALYRRFASKATEGKEGWEFADVSDILRIRSERNREGEVDEVFSVSKSRGVVNQLEHLGRRYATTDVSAYKIVRPGDVVFTKSPTAGFPFGIVKQNLTGRTGVVSPLYGVYQPVAPAVGLLIDAFFRSSVRAARYLAPIVTKGAKNTINATDADFLRGSAIPIAKTSDEQRLVGGLLEAIAALTAVTREKRAMTTQFRSAVLDRLIGRRAS